jgi:uncharacterized protein YyaL (SSP411 family)
MPNPKEKMMPSNKLVNEKSPYLLQHAHNPVNWHPWSDDTFTRARAENKPVFLSIGYATCHWCHVMEKESFEDEETAGYLNETFICIKVDREERPDIDAVYMAACQMLTGSGGWPLNLFITPDKKPFFAATYLPKRNRFGRAGVIDLCQQVKKLWESDPAKVNHSADSIAAGLDKAFSFSSADEPDQAVNRIKRYWIKPMTKSGVPMMRSWEDLNRPRNFLCPIACYFCCDIITREITPTHWRWLKKH